MGGMWALTRYIDRLWPEPGYSESDLCIFRSDKYNVCLFNEYRDLRRYEDFLFRGPKSVSYVETVCSPIYDALLVSSYSFLIIWFYSLWGVHNFTYSFYVLFILCMFNACISNYINDLCLFAEWVWLFCLGCIMILQALGHGLRVRFWTTGHWVMVYG